MTISLKKHTSLTTKEIQLGVLQSHFFTFCFIQLAPERLPLYIQYHQRVSCIQLLVHAV